MRREFHISYSDTGTCCIREANRPIVWPIVTPMVCPESLLIRAFVIMIIRIKSEL